MSFYQKKTMLDLNTKICQPRKLGLCLCAQGPGPLLPSLEAALPRARAIIVVKYCPFRNLPPTSLLNL